jgi:hypothetical protein
VRPSSPQGDQLTIRSSVFLFSGHLFLGLLLEVYVFVVYISLRDDERYTRTNQSIGRIPLPSQCNTKHIPKTQAIKKESEKQITNDIRIYKIILNSHQVDLGQHSIALLHNFGILRGHLPPLTFLETGVRFPLSAKIELLARRTADLPTEPSLMYSFYLCQIPSLPLSIAHSGLSSDACSLYRGILVLE